MAGAREWNSAGIPHSSGVSIFDGASWAFHNNYTQGALQVDAVLVAQETPEPATWVLAASGLALAARRRFRKQ